MLNSSIQKPFLKELEMLTSIEDQEHSSRVSKFLIGQLQTKDTDGNWTYTQDRLGIML